jgi:hypothetical protein
MREALVEDQQDLGGVGDALAVEIEDRQEASLRAPAFVVLVALGLPELEGMTPLRRRAMASGRTEAACSFERRRSRRRPSPKLVAKPSSITRL